MSVTSKALSKILSSQRRSTINVSRRRELWKMMSQYLPEIVKKVAFEIKYISPDSVFMRFVPENATYIKNYSDLFRLPPDEEGKGGYSNSNRFTGITNKGTLGLNGSYWGTANGVAGEDTYYSMWRGYDGSGPPRLIAKSGYVVVQRAKHALNSWEDQDIPKQILYSGNNATNIIVARTIKPIPCLNLDFGDPVVQSLVARCEPLFRQMLDALEFNSLEEAIEDPEFREFAREFVHAACKETQVEGIWVRTVRHELGERLDGFKKEGACNLILLGNGNETLTDRLVGCGVIKIRSNSNGLEVTAVPLQGSQSPYNDGQDRALTIWKPSGVKE
jgi:hypothetical protein